MRDPGAAPLQRILAFAGLVLMGASAALAPHPVFWIRVAPPSLAMLLAVVALIRPGAGGAIAVLAALVSAIAMTGIAWQLTMPIALALFALALRARPAFGPLRQPLGRVPVWGTVGCAAVTPFALVGWFVLFRPDLRSITGGIPDAGPVVLAFGSIGFAVVTAVGEELIWRGLIQSRLSTLVLEREAIFLQALSFGAQHAHGFPRGVVGVVLVAVWAAGLGLLRNKAAGLLAPVLAHFVADITIATIVLASTR